MASKSIPLIALFATMMAAPLSAQSEPRFSLGALYLFGNVDGSVQTPAGGEPGTTSSHRPTLSEIGIDTASTYDVQVLAGIDDNEFYAGGQWIRMAGSATLDETLVSQAQTFATGSQVSSEVDLDWYRFGYRRRMSLGGRRDWTLWPSVGAAFLDFHYRLRGEGASADRTYIKGNAQFGLETEWRPAGRRFALSLILLGCPPISTSFPQMNVEELRIKYRLIERGNSDLELSGGIAFEQILYEDSQTTPNRIRADFGPMFVVGLNWSF